MDADRIIALLDTLPAADVRRIAARANELAALYTSWADADNAAPAMPDRAVSYRQEYVRCGKARCKRCEQGPGHGPYWYGYWSEGGKTRKRYVGRQRPGELSKPG